MRIKRLGLFVISLLLMANLGFAAMGSVEEESYFEKMDADSDGKISPHEFSSNIKEIAFEQIDTDQDKVVDYDEWEQYGKSVKSVERFNELDKDKNQKLSFVEFEGGQVRLLKVDDFSGGASDAKKLFMKMDTDKDHYVSQDELEKSRKGGKAVRFVSFKF